MSCTTRFVAAVACLALVGCASPEVNPPKPAAKTGYIDFYTDSGLELFWEIKRAEPPSGEMRTVYSELKPVPGNVLRLGAPPGSYRFQVWFLNCVTEGPQTVEAQVQDGKVTPVHLTLKLTGTTTVDQKVYGFRGSAKGYARGTKIVSEQNEIYQIGAVAEAPQAYQPKERMPYFSPGPK